MEFGSAYNKGCSNMLLLFNKVSWLFLPLFFFIGTFSADSQKMKCLFFFSHSLSFSLSSSFFSLLFNIVIYYLLLLLDAFMLWRKRQNFTLERLMLVPPLCCVSFLCLRNLLDHHFQWPQESLSCETLTCHSCASYTEP